MQELVSINQDASTLVMRLNGQLGPDMRAHVQLYDGEYVDAEVYSHTKVAVLRTIPDFSSGTVCSTSELLRSSYWGSFDKKRRQVVRRCVMHLAVTREANVKLFTLTGSGNPLFQIV